MSDEQNNLPDWTIYLAVILIVGIFAAWVFYVNGQM